MDFAASDYSVVVKLREAAYAMDVAIDPDQPARAGRGICRFCWS